MNIVAGEEEFLLMRIRSRRTMVVLQVLAIGLLAAVLLSGCATPPAPSVVQTRYEVERVTLPAGLLSCLPAPPAAPVPILQSGVATYLVRLDEAYQDCADTVASIAQIENAPANATP
jgi:hypothetical protein